MGSEAPKHKLLTIVLTQKYNSFPHLAVDRIQNDKYVYFRVSYEWMCTSITRIHEAQLILAKLLAHQVLSSNQPAGFQSLPHYSWEHHQQDIRDYAALENQGIDRHTLWRQLETWYYPVCFWKAK